MSSGSANERAATGPVPHVLPALGIVLVAAGRGERLGGALPKAFTLLGGRTLIEHCLDAIRALPHSGHIVLVVPDERASEALALVAEAVPRTIPQTVPRTVPRDATWEISVVPGGRERHESVRFGLEALPEQVTEVLVHDAARPLASTALFDRVIDELRRTGDSVIPVLPVVDTLKRVDGEGVVHETVDRSALVSVQTPQGFPRELLAAAHERLGLGSGDAGDAPTDDAEVVQRADGLVRTVSGEMLAHKLTTPEDLELLEALLANTRGAGR